MNCLLHGCGAANAGVVCQEIDDDSYSCSCPDGNTTVVEVGDTFAGCTEVHEHVFAVVNITNIEIILVNGVEEILGVVAVQIDDESFSLNVTATVPIDTIGQHIREKIAEYLGAGYTADDITIDYVTKRAHTGTVIVRMNSQSNAGVQLSPMTIFFTVGLCLFKALLF